MNPLYQHLEQLLVTWQSLQPLKKEDQLRLWKKLRLEWNYHSNRIEGNTLTYGETEILLINGRTTGDHELRDYVEMQAHDVAIDHMKSMVSDARPLTEADIRNFNLILMKEPFWKDAITPDGDPTRIEILPGEYKRQPNNVRTPAGEIFRFADPVDVPARMNDLVEWLREALEKKELHPIEIASKLHHDFVLIHPFGDGNGRTARILVNFVLMRSGYLPLIVPTEQKDRYLAALNRADTGDLPSLTDYLARCLEISMDWGIAAAKGESIEEADDLIKEIELLKRRQTGEARNVVPKSNPALQGLYTGSLRPLFEEFVGALHRLDSLFTEITITSSAGPFQGRPWHQVLDEWAQRPSLSQSSKIDLTYTLKGFKGSAPKPFNAKSLISVHFDEFHYRITVAGKSGTNRLYGEALPASDRKAIARSALEHAFAQVKKGSGEKSP
jgi:Fic family protein